MRRTAASVLLLVLIGSALSAQAAQKSIADLVEQTSSSVVYIEGDRGCGSGFVRRTTPKVEIVTNHHVMKSSKTYTICFFMKSEVTGKTQKIAVRGYRYFAFPWLDFGVIRLIDTDPELKRLRPRIKALPIGDSQKVRVGEQVFLIGSPGAGLVTLGNSVSEGIISGKNRHVKGIPYFQTTAPVNFGNSGGPLLNMKGQVIGLVTSKSAFAESIGFALPIHMTEGKHYAFYTPEKLGQKATQHMAAGGRLLAMRRFDEACREYQAAQRLEPRTARPVMAEAHARLAQGRPEMAAQLFKKAMGRSGVKYTDLIACVLELGKIYGRAHNTAKAIEVFQAGLERDPLGPEPEHRRRLRQHRQDGQGHRTLVYLAQHRAGPAAAQAQPPAPARPAAEMTPERELTRKADGRFFPRVQCPSQLPQRQEQRMRHRGRPQEVRG